MLVHRSLIRESKRLVSKLPMADHCQDKWKHTTHQLRSHTHNFLAVDCRFDYLVQTHMWWLSTLREMEEFRYCRAPLILFPSIILAYMRVMKTSLVGIEFVVCCDQGEHTVALVPRLRARVNTGMRDPLLATTDTRSSPLPLAPTAVAWKEATGGSDATISTSMAMLGYVCHKVGKTWKGTQDG